MLTKNEIDEFDLPKSFDELHHDIMLTDHDSFTEDDFLQTISNLDIPILQENDSILLRDASADEIMLEATNNDLSALTPPRDLQSPTYSVISNSLDTYNVSDSSQQQSFNYSNSECSPSKEIKLEDIKIENTISDYDQCSFIHNNFSNFLFPSQIPCPNPTDVVPDNKFTLDTPPISPPEINEYNSDSNIILSEKIQFKNYPQAQIVLNSSKYRLLKINCDDESKNNLKNENIIRNNCMAVKRDPKCLKISTKFQNLRDTREKIIAVDNSNVSNMKSTQPAIVNIQNLALSNKLPLVQCYSKQCTTENNNVQIISIPNTSCNTAVVVKSVNGMKTNKLNNVPDVDLKAMKRHQRMIKNRESACMSRKRKRDYVTSLEVQIKQLSVENQNLKTENEMLRRKLSESGSGLKQFLYCMPTNGHKNSALLLAMLLMISLNIGSIGFFYKRENNDILKYSRIKEMSTNHKQLRSLLWVPETWSNDTEYEDHPNISNFDSSNRSNTKFSLCSMFINQTESIRLASQLHKWIGEPLFNLTNPYHLKNLNKKRKISIKNTIRSLGEFTGSNKYFSLKKSYRQRRQKNGKRNEVQVYSFDPKYYEYAQFFESIDKRDDTFYVVSFSGDHMLLPALNHNKTLRPKMSLILPALSINDSKSSGNDHITFMKIDCDVTDTNVVHVKGDLIPQHIRNTLTNSTECKTENKSQKSKVNIKTPKKINNATSDNVTLFETQDNKIYKPYFIKDNLKEIDEN